MRSSLLRSSLPSFVLTLPALLGLAATGCGSNGGSGSGPAPDTGTAVASTVSRNLTPSVPSADETSLVTGNTDFALQLYHQLAGVGGAGTTGNLFYSPYSVSLALAMTYAGAGSTTATQMATALSFTLPDSRLNPAFDKLDLAIQAKPANATGADGAPFALDIANSLWGNSETKFGTPFINALSANYGAGLRTVDFASDAAQAETAINNWVASETDDKIDPLLGPGAVDASTLLVLVNAVYFNSSWETSFEASESAPGPFTEASGKVVQTNIMSSSSTATAYAKGSDYVAVELPYSGGTASMVIVLPNVGSYSAVEKGLSGAFFDEVTHSLYGGESINLTMPSFKVHGGSVSLVPELKALGMTDAFEPHVADFKAMIPAGDAYVSDVVHQAFVDVDESGTVAAAATAVTVSKASVAEESVTVNVNRPFFFFIRDVASNTILFVGRENDPTQS